RDDEYLLPGVDLRRPARERTEMMLDGILRDVRHAVRGLAKNRGYACVFIVTLGLGIGANTAMFSAVNGVLLRPLPHEDGDRLVYLRHTAPLGGIENALFSVPEIEDYRRGTPSLDAVAEFSAMTFAMLGHETPRRVRAGIVTGNYFDVMGLSASLGRMVGVEDDGDGAAAVIVLSDAYWRSVFGADPDVLGKTVRMNGLTATIVGVAEPAPPYPERTDIYVNMAASPHHLDASMNHDRIHRMTEVFAKLAPDATVESVLAETERVTTRVHREYPEAYDPGSGYQVTVTPLKIQLTSRARPTLLLLLATASLVLVIACANLANLTLTRVLRRGDELAIRVSLGGSRGALRRALLVESLLLAGAGAVLGLVLASAGLDVLVAFTSRFTSRAFEIGLDPSVFGFALVAAVAASVFFTVLPPLPDGSRVELTRTGARSTGSSRGRRVQRLLVVAQIATSFVLLVGAGLLLRTMSHLNRIDPGFDTVQVLSMDVPPSMDGRPEQQVRNLYLAMLDDVSALPGVERVALTSTVPLNAESGFTAQLAMDVEGHDPPPNAPEPRADFRVVSPGYFATMGIDVIRGREFAGTDTEDAQGVVVINESMARAYFGDDDPVGKRIAWTDDTLKFLGMSPEWRIVVGVVADTRDVGLDADVLHTMYNPYRQVTPFFTRSLVMRVTVPPPTVVPAIREVILAHDPNQPIDDIATIAELGDESVAPRRLNATLLGGFAALALVIAAVGIGGVLAFSVGTRTREFGVRSALGAARGQIQAGVLGEGARLAAAGIAIGVGAALLVTRFLAGLLIGVPALDPVTFIAVGLLLGGVAVFASWIPAWRAGRISPMEAMRAD
ncbi:MAG: ABC transporter permease, partial [Gemmatimonadota bacterium]|nr:ABC transporter permease [Gemmatimonadota bacterium]